jgi:NAD(P)-dependent dehydrogenase (short-subunit alcohol dehydrogenase family)
MPLQGKKVFITGAGQGIGKAIARQFLLEGATVCAIEIDSAAAKETQSEYGQLGDIRIFPGDAGKDRSIESAMDKAAKHMGGINILVNNAGIFAESHMPIEKLTLNQWNRVLAVNLTSVFLCSKVALPYLKVKGGSIVNIASTRAFMSEADTEAYAAAKGGIVALTHSLAVSLGPKVRVNCVSPGWIDTSLWQKHAERHQSKLKPTDNSQHPAGRVGRPEDIAEAVIFLASSKSGFITGANLVVDGGMTKKMIYAE